MQIPTKISFFGHFGSLNSGNEATLLATVSRVRERFPDCELSCICTSPENVLATLGIAAVPHTVRSDRIWNRQAPLGKRLRSTVLGLREEIGEYVRAAKVLKGTDVLIVPGTGLLTDAWGLSGWGPYGLLKWSLMAKLRHCRLMFVSVGAGPVDTRLGRLLLRAALVLADYRSYRDRPSKEVVESLGVMANDDPIYPDLVFDLSPRELPSAPETSGSRPVVGLGLMEYGRTYSFATPRRDTYVCYLESLADFVGWLLDNGYDVRLLLGDADIQVIDDFKTVLRERIGALPDERVTYRPIRSVHDLLAQMSATDVVVATRFHNVLMSLLLEKPVVAIAFHHKCSSLMDDLGLAAYCHDINRMDAEALIAQFQTLVLNADDVKRSNAHRIQELRRALDEQYGLLFGDVADRPARVETAPVAT